MKTSFFAGILIAGFLPCVASAALVVDNFNDGNDSANPVWNRVNPIATGSYSFPGGNSYMITTGVSPSPTTIGPARAGSVLASSIETNFVAQVDLVDWSASPTTVAGVLARISQVGLGTTDGYVLAILPSGGTGSFSINRITNEGSTGIGTSANVTLVTGTDYRLIFSGNGSNLTGQIFSLSDLVNPLATIDATDATYASGVQGLLVFDGTPPTSGSNSVSATFDNFSSIPEPSALLLALSALGLVSLHRRR